MLSSYIRDLETEITKTRVIRSTHEARLFNLLQNLTALIYIVSSIMYLSSEQISMLFGDSNEMNESGRSEEEVTKGVGVGVCGCGRKRWTCISMNWSGVE